MPDHEVLSAAGDDALDRLGPGLDALHAATGVPVTARRAWLESWADCYRAWEPWCIAVTAGDGDLAGAAVLARRRLGPLVDVVGLGHGPSDSAALPARDEAAARALARAVVAHLRSLRPAWRLRVEQLPEGDAVATAIARDLPHAAIVRGDGCPRIHVDEGSRPDDYLSDKVRRDERRAVNRLMREGLGHRVEHLRRPEEVLAALPELVRVHRQRDRALSRKSDLDVAESLCFYRRVVARHAEHGEVQLSLLRIDGELAAYDLTFLDGAAYRFWDGRIDTRWGRFSPGHLLCSAVLKRAAEDRRVAELDWMRGEETYKLRIAATVAPHQHLHAWSSPPVRALDRAPRRARAAFAAARDRHPGLQRAWLAVKSRTVLRGRAGDPGSALVGPVEAVGAVGTEPLGVSGAVGHGAEDPHPEGVEG
ncbi:MAG: GNAT family N-acetyltransferase [Actinomycetota bacterium]|nr:GNAT family N-acetyltransferase [Actinomycetota bacterium]